jgi:hypothetical protein
MQTVWINRIGASWSHGRHVPHATVSDLHALRALLGA